MAGKPEQEQQDQQTGPVPIEKHYQAFKDVEKTIHAHLKNDPHEELLIGLRVAYDEKDSGNEPGVLPYSIESGYLGFVDLLFDQQTEPTDNGEHDLPEGTWTFPLPADMIEELYQMTKNALQSAAGEAELNVGVFYVFTGSPPQAGGIRCSCKGQANKRQRVTGTSTSGTTGNSCRDGC